LFRRLDSITLFSENPTKLAEFYQEKVGLNCTTEAAMGETDDTNLYGFEFGEESTGLYIVEHSEVKGKNPEPSRIIFNLEVDNIEPEMQRLEQAGIKKIQDLYHVENYGQIVTFEDLDGNYFQLVQVRPNE
jgi:predicted enzyme related to lactoylglutathione lyase